MTRRRKFAYGTIALLCLGTAFVYTQIDIVRTSIQFDLKMIGESIYESRSKSGKWPASINDLEGTAYLKLPYRRGILEQGKYMVVWHAELKLNPADNRDRILAYDNVSFISRFGKTWVCRGDLTVEYLDSHELNSLLGE